MSTQWLKARQTKYAAYVTVYILVVVAIVTVVNVLANRYTKSYDSTANRRFSLSEQTVKIISGLKEDATILYFGDGSFENAKDLLDRYANLSHKVHVEYINVDRNPLLARANNIVSLGTSVVQIGNKKQQARGLTEEEITGAFIRDLKDKARTVCFLTGSGEHPIESADDPDSYVMFRQLLEKEDYTAKSISLLEKPEVPGECTVVVAGGPERDYPQPEVDTLAKFVETGGRALIMLDAPMKVGHGITDNNALLALLQQWGVTADKNLILDPIGQRLKLGATVAVVTSYDQHPIVHDLIGKTATAFPFARSLQVRSQNGIEVQKLCSSSEHTVAITKLDSPNLNGEDPNNPKGPFIIGAAGIHNTGQANTQGRFVVFGSSTWASSHIGFEGNADLALNTIDWLASDEDLISIRPKGPDSRPVTIGVGQMLAVRLTSLLMIPFAAIIAGIVVWARRR